MGSTLTADLAITKNPGPFGPGKRLDRLGLLTSADEEGKLLPVFTLHHLPAPPMADLGTEDPAKPRRCRLVLWAHSGTLGHLACFSRHVGYYSDTTRTGPSGSARRDGWGAGYCSPAGTSHGANRGLCSLWRAESLQQPPLFQFHEPHFGGSKRYAKDPLESVRPASSSRTTCHFSDHLRGHEKSARELV